MGWPGPMTHRQLAAWKRFLDEQQDRHDLVHYYLRLIATEIRRSNQHIKHPERVKEEQLTLRFTHQPQAVPQQLAAEDRKERAARSRAVWGAIMQAAAGKKGG